MGIALITKSFLVVWFIILSFGIGAILLLFRYFNPNSKFFPEQEEYEKLSPQEFEGLCNSTGIFPYNENGFEVALHEKLLKIDWNGNNRITAYKIDLFTTDKICLFVEAEDGKQFEISETTEGWFQFVQNTKEQFSGINKIWEIEIANPAFDRKVTKLYNRNNTNS